MTTPTPPQPEDPWQTTSNVGRHAHPGGWPPPANHAPYPPQAWPPQPPGPVPPPTAQPAGYPPPGVLPPGAQQPAAPPARKRRTGLIVGLAVGAVVLLCCGGVAIAAALGGGSHPTTTPVAAPATTATSSPHPVASRHPSSPGARTTTPAPVGPGPAVAAWARSGGQGHVNNLLADFNDLQTAAQAADPPQVRAVCVRLQGHVEAAQAYTPIPDGTAQAAWSAALAQYARAATDCIAGIDAGDSDLITRSGQELTAGTTQIRVVSDRMKALAG